MSKKTVKTRSVATRSTDDILADVGSLPNKLGRVHKESNPGFVVRICQEAMREIVGLYRRIDELES